MPLPFTSKLHLDDDIMVAMQKLAKIEEDIAKAEALGGELEARLVAASESGDGNAITAIAKDMDDNKKTVDQLYEDWEKTSAELESAKDRYPI